MYLVIRKVISWQTPVAYIATVAILTLIAAPAGIDNVEYMLYNVFGGGLMLGAILHGYRLCHLPRHQARPADLRHRLRSADLFIRCFGSYPEGVCYSILIMNCSTWLLDKYTVPPSMVRGKKDKKEAAK